MIAPRWFDAKARPAGAAPGAAPAAEREAVVPGDLVCAACGRRITHDDHRIAIGGAHEHTFVNPVGEVYQVGCFAMATGLAYLGAPDPAFTWFPGYTWQVAVCGACRAHLGWIYRAAGAQFHGLVLPRLARRG